MEQVLDETGASADAVIGRLLQFWGWAALNAEGNQMLQRKDVRERLEGLGADPAGGTSAELGRHLAEETTKWKRIVQLSGAKAD